MTPSDTGNEPAPIDLEQADSTRRLPPTTERPYDPAPFRDKMRARLAIVLVAILAATILIPFLVIAWMPERAQAVHDHLGLVFTPLVALVASAVGYYFAARNTDGS
jgi:hypothetical protein